MQIKKERTRKGAIRFVVDFRHAGRRYRKYFVAFEDADTYLSDMKLKIYGNQFRGRPKPVSVAQLTREYLTDSAESKTPATHRDTDQFRLGRFLAFIYNRRTGRTLTGAIVPAMALIERNNSDELERDQDVSDFVRFLQKTRLEGISPLEIKEYRSSLKMEGHPHSTINSYLATVRNVFGTAVEAKYLAVNPAAGIKKFPEDGKLINPYTKQVIIELLRAARADDQRRNHRYRKSGWTFHLFEVVATALFAGLRERELGFLAWPDVDFERDLIWIKAKPADGFKPKWYQERTIPLEPLLRQILEPLKKPSGWCFPTGSGGIYKNDMLSHLKRAGKSLGLEKLNVHFLRHNYASHQIMHGVPHLHVMKWMGHKEPETLLRYVHISPGTNRFKNPSIFAEKDIYALLDEKPKEESKVIPIAVQNDSGSIKTGG